MKRIIPASLILISVILICIFGNYYVKNVCRDLKSDLSECIDAFSDGDNEKAAVYADDINKRWQSEKKGLAVFVNHAFIDEISVSANALPYYLRLKSDEMVYGEYSNILVAIRHIVSEHSVTADNFY